ncbi:MAG: DUF1801 domain-containing protein [Hyphomicrobiales bacterium]
MTIEKAFHGARFAAEAVETAIGRFPDWRGETLARIRALILQADPGVTEDVKWRKPSNDMQGVPVWEHHGLLCTGEAYRAVVKLTFARGAALDDPERLFNASLDGGTRRVIDLREGERIDPDAFQALIRAAIEENRRAAAARTSGKR